MSKVTEKIDSLLKEADAMKDLNKVNSDFKKLTKMWNNIVKGLKRLKTPNVKDIEFKFDQLDVIMDDATGDLKIELTER